MPTRVSRRPYRGVVGAWLVAGALLAGPVVNPAGAVIPAGAVDPAVLAEFRRDPDRFFFDLRHLDIVACADALLNDPAAAPADRALAFRALGQMYAARGARGQARTAFVEFLRLEPAAELEPASAWPPPVTRLFYAVKDSLAMAGGPDVPGGGEAPGDAGPPDASARPAPRHTLAIGPIDNHSPALPDAPFDMDRFAAGLVQMITSDLQPATALRLVDRQRLGVLRDEIGLAATGFADPEQGVRAGRLLGAQSYLFGGVTLLPGGTIRLDLRLVETETGEVLLSASKVTRVRKGEDLLSLEREVVESLAKRLDDVIADAGKAAMKADVAAGARSGLRRRKGSGDMALRLLDSTGLAILAEDAGHLTEAAAAWREVARLDPGDPLAAERLRAIETGLKYAALEVER